MSNNRESAIKNLKNSYLVLRMGSLFTLNPIKEVDEVIKKNGFSWFAKFGTRVANTSVRKMIDETSPYLVVILLNKTEYISKTYKLIDVAKEPPPKNELYPDYYVDQQRFIATWFKIEDSLHQVDINNLIVKSSFQKLRHLFKTSMGSSFYCTTIE
ncbi:hypothetical protein [Candidatus Methylopumilus rimovensis]|jgi:hypothetical protein|uniref:hypothetical protein n=1 Tax=Candidatus Methylopumilus rimovensis TaxID=2588535 RepID=UPI00111F87DD|nr:hypothetical protein [Candidatus Methylopumilus rimovensis]QDD11862.1 hypothetical protein FIT62_01610 [Candidatus Methylopumilus rimovensis]